MNFLSNDNMIGRILTKIGDLVILNLLFIGGCIPFVTAGASLCALYTAALKMHRHPSASPARDFIKSFKQNFRQATIAWLILVFVMAAAFLDIRMSQAWEGTALYLPSRYFFQAVLIAAALLGMYLFPVIAAFENKLFILIRSAVYFACQKPLYALAVASVNILPLYFTYADIALMPLYACIWFFAGFGIQAAVNSWFFIKLFSPYLPPAKP